MRRRERERAQEQESTVEAVVSLMARPEMGKTYDRRFRVFGELLSTFVQNSFVSA